MVELFGRGIVLIATNPEKQHMFTGEERQGLIQRTIKEIDLEGKVGVSATYGYVFEWAKQLFPSDGVLVRGIRGAGDLKYEMKIARFNRSHGVDTLFLPADEGLYLVSSSQVKKMMTVENPSFYEMGLMVPRCVENTLTNKYLKEHSNE
jgi:phosphopantetheine adenylyltransferase